MARRKKERGLGSDREVTVKTAVSRRYVLHVRVRLMREGSTDLSMAGVPLGYAAEIDDEADADDTMDPTEEGTAEGGDAEEEEPPPKVLSVAEEMAIAEERRQQRRRAHARRVAAVARRRQDEEAAARARVLEQGRLRAEGRGEVQAGGGAVRTAFWKALARQQRVVRARRHEAEELEKQAEEEAAEAAANAAAEADRAKRDEEAKAEAERRAWEDESATATTTTGGEEDEHEDGDEDEDGSEDGDGADESVESQSDSNESDADGDDDGGLEGEVGGGAEGNVGRGLPRPSSASKELPFGFGMGLNRMTTFIDPSDFEEPEPELLRYMHT